VGLGENCFVGTGQVPFSMRDGEAPRVIVRAKVSDPLKLDNQVDSLIPGKQNPNRHD
jgi:hypothetical protein